MSQPMGKCELSYNTCSASVLKIQKITSWLHMSLPKYVTFNKKDFEPFIVFTEDLPM